ncbi:PREDICTED: phospholipid scramblase 2 [Nicrophorus vespilloides]|uniref:Phospholipid scramblase n=1 Tax=Nicrophorus vespilloides TaxID=110193 RepID=A0ABM1NH01_NICVS|nr:PREDICTED: phospholipid scramblase 2 [Nicrophorus vespilloides]XP_017786102.1 PREDICTED: phospholipid scramblase 2 [Nicrophorus vespilloides]XP_017786103.1 PREDICTED: phospholipid scramblase 2 [Nicrophorus vespilloides]XP_017786104.1 PREDICTED: phospholipid scramblase 2 [Nicrophorus vespilloides]
MSYPPPQGTQYPNQYNANYPPAPPQGVGQYPPAPPGAYPPPGYAQPPGYNQPQPVYNQPPGPYPPPGAGQYPPPGGFPGQYQTQGYAPVVDQPVSQGGGPNSGWMHMPQGPVNCPPGLEYLTMIDQLLVHQKVELLEALTGFETNNKFTVKNSIGQKVYYAVETNDCLTRNCCGPMRPFDMIIMDNFRNQVMHLHRPLACDSCCFPCCLQSMEVSSPPGTVIGTVEQEWSIFCPTFAIKNASGDTVLRVEGPFCTTSICGDVEFKITSSDGNTQVGKISKMWSGLVREMFTDTDFFGITFPMDLDVRMKAVMMGACFLIDAMFFEKTNNGNV